MKRALLSAIFIFCILVQYAQNGHLTRHFATLNNYANRVRAINPFDSLHVWGICSTNGYDTSAAARASNMEMIYSSDGGINWQTHTIPHTSFSDSFTYAMFWPAGPTTCFLAMFNHVTNSGGKVLRTIDSGATWQTSLTYQGGFLNSMVFFTPDSGLAMGDPVGGYYEMYTTSNAGQSWVRVPQGNIPAPLNNETCVVGKFAISGNSIYLTTSLSRVIYSTNKGISWQLGVDTVSFPGYAKGDWVINNAGHIILSGSTTQYYYSNDLGVTKTLKDFPQQFTRTYDAPFRTKADDAFVITSYHLKSGMIDSQYISICNSNPSVPSNWKTVSANSTNEYVSETVHSGSYFYNRNLGWLPGYWLDTLPGNVIVQAINRYSNCVYDTIVTALPTVLCARADPITLLDYVVSDPVTFTVYDYSNQITQFNPADYLPGNTVWLVSLRKNGNNCYSDHLDSLHIAACIGVEEVPGASIIKVYPNPAHNILNVERNFGTNATISIADITGKILIQQSAQTNAVNIASLSSGVYFIAVETGKDKRTGKFVKE